MVTKYGIPPMPSIWGRVVHQKILYVLFHLTLYIILATCYFVPWIYLIPDNFTFYIHMAPVNASNFFYLTFFRYPYYGGQNLVWDYLELNIFMAQNNMSPIYTKATKKNYAGPSCPHICIKLVAVFGYHSYQLGGCPFHGRVERDEIPTRESPHKQSGTRWTE